MLNLRKYGDPPYSVAVIHGGPGAGGEMAPVARELSTICGVLEPIQTASTLDGQVDELKTVLEEHGDIPVTLIGFSWGAWLSYIVTAKYPELVSKLILVGSGGFESKYGDLTRENRLNRLSDEERAEFTSLIQTLVDPDSVDRDVSLARLGALVEKTDVYDPMPSDPGKSDLVGGSGDIFQSVWTDAENLRKCGELLTLANDIKCPVVAIHGDYDPHPADGVKDPLSSRLKDFRFTLLRNCGHTPWLETQARDGFYEILKNQVTTS